MASVDHQAQLQRQLHVQFQMHNAAIDQQSQLPMYLNMHILQCLNQQIT